MDGRPQKCNHQWRKAGLWDGKTPQGQRTGGVLYRCGLCSEKAFSLEEIKRKGGTIEENTNVFGDPKTLKTRGS